MPLTFGRLKTRKGKPKLKTACVLLDSGGSSTVIWKEFAKNLRVKRCPQVQWSTMAGDVKTSHKTKIEFSLPEFYEDRILEWDVHVSDTLPSYDMIIQFL